MRSDDLLARQKRAEPRNNALEASSAAEFRPQQSGQRWARLLPDGAFAACPESVRAIDRAPCDGEP